MAVKKGHRVYLGQFDLQTHLRASSLNLGVEGQDDTCLADTTRTMEPGLVTAGTSIEGKFTGALDTDLHSQLELEPVMSFLDGSTAETARGYSLSVMNSAYDPIANSIGELMGFTFSGAAAGQNVYRTLLIRQGALAATSFTSSILQVSSIFPAISGAAIAGWSVIAHSIAFNTSLSAVLEADNDSDMSSARTVATAAPVAAGAAIADGAFVSGDDYLRVSVTHGDPSTYAIVLGARYA